MKTYQKRRIKRFPKGDLKKKKTKKEKGRKNVR